MSENNQLSERELEILQLVATGASNKDIAKQLVISINTVKVHLRNVYAKLGVSSRTEATMWAVNNGIVETQASDSEDEATSSETNSALDDGDTSETSADKYRFVKWAAGIAGVLLLVVILFYAGISYRNSQLPEIAVSQGQGVEQNRWQDHSPLPEPRKNFGAATYENTIYIIAGELDAGITDSVLRYDPVQKNWQPSAAKPIAVTDIGAVALGGKVYVPGGRLADGQMTSQLDVYDPRLDQWEQGTPLPVPISAYALVTFEGQLFVIGGWDGEHYLDSVYAYDPSLASWSVRSPMPTARAYAGAAVALGKVYVVGGYDGEAALDVNEEYWPELDDGSAKPWMPKQPIPEPCYRMGLASIAEIIHVIGWSSNNYRYYPQEDTWTPFPPIHQNTWTDLSLISLGSNLYALGGQQDNVLSDTNISYQAIYTVGIPVLQNE